MKKKISPESIINNNRGNELNAIRGGISGVTYAILAGASAASASVFGKLAMDSSVIHGFVQSIPNDNLFPIEQVEYVLRAICFAMIFAANAFMWNFFVKSMNLSSSLNATVINSSLNYFFSAFFGYLIFGEPLSLSWWLGASLILFGVFLITNGSKKNDAKDKEQ